MRYPILFPFLVRTRADGTACSAGRAVELFEQLSMKTTDKEATALQLMATALLSDSVGYLRDALNARSLLIEVFHASSFAPSMIALSELPQLGEDGIEQDAAKARQLFLRAETKRLVRNFEIRTLSLRSLS